MLSKHSMQMGHGAVGARLKPEVHYAFYEFDDLAAAKGILNSQEPKDLISEFDRKWQGRVARNRDIVERLQTI